ncbi:AfsR family transcriptional regulator [Streptomyces venezuelae]|uniref:AfsR family transcriptional regulator n=1 Tax=Streptomyces venezuelae TaxID=54571 RepID=A0A5P2D5I7_STRVZ|nr:BTAD domain-containing putative transcriptional regulator [Streptomyces venezuelae]QES50394.1 AfsR family transcriptional regulator [Streptomyces venezuelae]
MRYAILGTAQAERDDGSPVALGGARLRALLTALALRPGRAVPAEVLVAEVWGGSGDADATPPADAVAALQALVGRLRRAVGHAAVASGGRGYRLAADREDIDLFRFEDLARAAGRALAADDPGRAEDLYGEALALWRGPALADLPDAGAEAARWETVRMDARRGRLTAAVALGRADRVLPELTALCAERPLDEPLQALRIRALRETGRPAEALAAYEEVRRDLAARLGTDPGPGLRELQTELLNPPGPRDPAAPAAPAGVGPGGPGGPAAPAGNLRARLTTFVGREDDIRVIGQDLARARLVTLLGPGGAGKTRLSQEAAEAHGGGGAAAGSGGAGWPDGVWLIELAPVDDPDDVAEATLAALGARETKLRGGAADELRALTDRTGDDPLERLVEFCAGRRLLLLLDNCEHVIGAAARLAEELLVRCPGVRILATSREPLGVPGELLRPVDPLPDPVALRLLQDRGAAARPGFSVAEDPAAAVEICRRLDGLPLAIELAAARLRLLSPRQIADRLDNRFRLLTSGSRTVLPRQQTLRAVVDWSWDLLDEHERTVLRRLSVFAGGCDLAAAEAVCAAPVAGGATGAPADVAGQLGALVDKSLVVATPTAEGEMRYRLLETVGEYAAERLAETPGDKTDTERRHLVHYRELARTTEPLFRGRRQRAAARTIATEYENLRTALRRAIAAGEADEALCLVHSLVWYWHMHDLRTESRHWSDATAALGPDPFQQPVVPARPVYDRIVDTPPPYTGELLTEAWRGIQMIRLASRDQSKADWYSPEVRTQLDGMLEAYVPGMPQTCRAPAALWVYAVMIAGDTVLLQQVIDATVDTARGLGHRWELASALQLRANVMANRADWAGNVARDAEESLAVFQDLGDDWGCAEALAARAESREKRGEYVRAAEDFRAAIRHAERLGAQGQVAVLRVRLAGTLSQQGESEGAEAEEILTEITGGRQRFGNEAMPAARMFLATRLGRTGRFAEARAQLRLLTDELPYGVYAVFDAYLFAVTAWLDNQEGAYEQTRTVLRQGLATMRDPLALLVAPQMPAVFLMTGAAALAGLGGPERAADAARLLGAYRALLPDGHVPVVTEREDAARAEELARKALGDAAYEAAYAEGGGLTLEQATALV